MAAATNRILARLQKLSAVSRKPESVSLPVGRELYRVGQALTHVYFPTQGVVSVLVQLESGVSAEVATIGNEGFIGLPIWLGQRTSIDQVVQQAPGEILRLPTRVFCGMIQGSRAAERLLKRFTIYSLRAGYQSAVCSAHHAVGARACRWLLSMAQRADSRHIQLSQEQLAGMLGVRRQTVSQLIGNLRRAGALESARGAMTVTDYALLERGACECYPMLNRLYASLVAPLL